VLRSKTLTWNQYFNGRLGCTHPETTSQVNTVRFKESNPFVLVLNMAAKGQTLPDLNRLVLHSKQASLTPAKLYSTSTRAHFVRGTRGTTADIRSIVVFLRCDQAMLYQRETGTPNF
jgi:hypothetical protein